MLTTRGFVQINVAFPAHAVTRVLYCMCKQRRPAKFRVHRPRRALRAHRKPRRRSRGVGSCDKKQSQRTGGGLAERGSHDRSASARWRRVRARGRGGRHLQRRQHRQPVRPRRLVHPTQHAGDAAHDCAEADVLSPVAPVEHTREGDVPAAARIIQICKANIRICAREQPVRINQRARARASAAHVARTSGAPVVARLIGEAASQAGTRATRRRKNAR